MILENRRQIINLYTWIVYPVQKFDGAGRHHTSQMNQEPRGKGLDSEEWVLLQKQTMENVAIHIQECKFLWAIGVGMK